MKENFWNVFETSGDPMAYLIYKKARKEDLKDKKIKPNYEKQGDI